MKIIYIIHFFLSLLSFGFIIFNLLKSQNYDETIKKKINDADLRLDSIKMCSDFFSNETFITDIIKLEDDMRVPMQSDCPYITEPHNKTINNLLERIIKYCENNKNSKLLDFFNETPWLKFPKIDDNIDIKEEEIECNLKEIKKLLFLLPKNIWKMPTLKFAIKIQVYEQTKACFKAFVLDSKNCLNPKYIHIIEDCIEMPLKNREGYCYKNTMSVKDIYEYVKLFNIKSTAKNVFEAKTNFFKDMSERCTYFDDLNPLINLDDKVEHFKNETFENSFTIRYYYSAYIDFCEKIKKFEQSKNNKENIKFIRNLKKVNETFFDKYGKYTLEMHKILLNFYNFTENVNLLDENKAYGNRHLPTNYDYYKKYAIIKNLNYFNLWLTRFSQARTSEKPYRKK